MKETNERFPSSKPVLWAWLDLNQRPHPYQACSRDAFMLVGEDDQLVGGVDVTVVVRWVPELSVGCGTRVARLVGMTQPGLTPVNSGPRRCRGC